MATIKNGWSIHRDFTMLPNAIVRSADFTPRAFRVLAFLMSHSEGWQTTTERIGQAIGMSAGTVKTAVKDLVEMGYLKRAQEHLDGGRFGAMTYILTDPADVQKLATGATTENTAFPQRMTDGQKTDSGKTAGGNLTPIRKPSKEDQPKEDQKNTNPTASAAGERPARPTYPAAFAQWWAAYPRRVGKRAAFKAWTRATREVGEGELLEATQAFASWHAQEGTAERFIPHPTTWLNRDGWADELPSPSRPGDGSPSAPSFFDFVPRDNAPGVVEGDAWGDLL